MDNDFFDERANRFYENQFSTNNHIKIFLKDIFWVMVFVGIGNLISFIVMHKIYAF